MFITNPPNGNFFFFFFNDTATTEIYPLSLHDALPISSKRPSARRFSRRSRLRFESPCRNRTDRKSTRLNSSHSQISYAVFCLKKKNTLKTLILRGLIPSTDAILHRIFPRRHYPVQTKT